MRMLSLEHTQQFCIFLKYTNLILIQSLSLNILPCVVRASFGQI